MVLASKAEWVQFLESKKVAHYYHYIFVHYLVITSNYLVLYIDITSELSRSNYDMINSLYRDS